MIDKVNRKTNSSNFKLSMNMLHIKSKAKWQENDNIYR